MFNKEHLAPEFLAINPGGTVPALIDGDLRIVESGAIATFLVDKYAKDNSLYPKDLVKRTKVLERLFYVSSYIFPRVYQLCVPIFVHGETEMQQRNTDEILRGYGTIESMLEGNSFLCGEALTLADLLLWCNLESALGEFIPVDGGKFPNLKQWWDKMRTQPCWDINKEGGETHVMELKACIEKNRLNASKG